MTREINEDEFRSISLILDHSWKIFEFRLGRALQILNFFLVTVAVMSAGYATALNSKQYPVAAVIGVMGALVAAASFMAGRNQNMLAVQATCRCATFVGG
jgi:hypothetical protein